MLSVALIERYGESIGKLDAIEQDTLMVDVFETPVGKAYPASRQPVSIQIDSYGGPASDPLSIGYTINWRGDSEQGSFNVETKTFTAGTTDAMEV